MQRKEKEPISVLREQIDQVLKFHHKLLQDRVDELLAKFVADSANVTNEGSIVGAPSTETVENITKNGRAEKIARTDMIETTAQTEAEKDKKCKKDNQETEDSYEKLGKQGKNKGNKENFGSESAPMNASEFHAVQLQGNLDDIKMFVRDNSPYHKYVELFGPIGNLFAMIETLKEPVRVGVCADFVQSKSFEAFTLFVIMLNSLYTLYDTNWQMSRLRETRPTVMLVMEVGFTCFYTFELGIKLNVHRLFFFCNSEMGWNLFDILLVFLSIFDTFLTLFISQDGIINTGFVRIVRILKIVKIFRFFRVLQFVTELRLMFQCVMGSISSLIWSFTLLGVITVVFAILFVQQLSLHVIENGSQLTVAQKASIQDTFGSVQLAVLTLFQAISGGEDWNTFYRIVAEAGDLSCFTFIIYVLFIWLSVENIITSIFVDKAMKLAKPDLDDLLLEKRKDDLLAACELRDLFLSIHGRTSGTLTLAEFEESLQDIRITSYFDLKGLSITHASLFFRMLASLNDTHEIDVETFVAGCLRMKGMASNIDVIALLYQSRLMSEKMRDNFQKSRNEVRQLRLDIKNCFGISSL